MDDTNLLYRQYVEDIRAYAKKCGVSEKETNEIFQNCFKQLEKLNQTTKCYYFLKIIKIIGVSIFTVIFCSICLYNHPLTHSIFLRNMQNYIYPGLTLFRQFAVPIITRYPSLSELYDESCLVENPFFQVTEMDCWPCSTVQSVPNMTGWNITKNFNVGIPFTRAESDIRADLNSIISLYMNNANIFNIDAPRISSNNPLYKYVNNLAERRLKENPSDFLDTHISWRINRMRPSRLLRKILPKPLGTPDWWSQSTERFIFIDEPKAAQYPLPNPECSNVILRCTSGSRLIKMTPSPECQRNCKASIILLSSQHSLWYNWWYWRPVSLPAINSSEISINYLTSFC